MSALDTILATEKITHDLVQGTPEWLAFRVEHDGASEAAAMLGLSKKVTRTELLQAKHTGLPREFSEFVQTRVLDRGHEVEALARPLVEADIGEDLYPATCSRGRVSASCDGITLDDRIVLEHKQWAEELAASVRAGIVPEEHMPQCQQILLVTGAERVRFVVSDGTAQRMVWVEVTPDLAWWQRLAAGWEQFHADLAAFVPPEVIDKPAIVGHRPDQLPALRSSVKGELVLESNIKEWEEGALAYIKSVREHELKSDDDFANADAAAKWCDASKTSLAGVRAQLMSATGDVNLAVGTLDRIMDELDKTRIAFNNAIKARKESRKGEIVAGGIAAFTKYIAGLNERLGNPYMPVIVVDFAGAIRGKSSLAKMEDAVATALANAKIMANEMADRITVNLRTYKSHGEYDFLFADLKQIVTKAPEDFQALVQNRVNAHQAEEKRKEEATRDRIRQEEADKLLKQEADANRMRNSEIDGIRQQVIIASMGRAGVRKGGTTECIRETLAETEAWPITEENFGPLTATAQAAKDNALAAIRALLLQAEQRDQLPVQSAAAAPIAPAASAQAASTPAANTPLPAKVTQLRTGKPTLKIGDIQDRLGIPITAAFIENTLAIVPAKRENRAVWFLDTDWERICQALMFHIDRARTAVQREAA